VRALATFNPAFLVDSLIALALAFALGGAIGLERQIRQRQAGLRTNVLVAVGAAAFVDLGVDVTPGGPPTQIIAYVIAGIGFLGAGVIMKEGAQVRGLNTAATLWCSAAVGACAGAGFAAQAVVLTGFVLAGNTLLRPLVDAINRQPMDEHVTEGLYQVHLVCEPAEISDMRDLLFAVLEKASYPIQSIETIADSADRLELAAVLAATTADPGELDAVVASLEASPGVESAAWTVGATS